jgi:hypothetical protein
MRPSVARSLPWQSFWPWRKRYSASLGQPHCQAESLHTQNCPPPSQSHRPFQLRQHSECLHRLQPQPAIHRGRQACWPRLPPPPLRRHQVPLMSVPSTARLLHSCSMQVTTVLTHRNSSGTSCADLSIGECTSPTRRRGEPTLLLNGSDHIDHHDRRCLPGELNSFSKR